MNTIYFSTPAPVDQAVLTQCTTAFRNFWEAAHAPALLTVGEFISSTARGTGSSVKIYNMGDLIPRPVIHEQPFVLSGTPIGTKQLPNEVAVCLTFKAAQLPGVRAQSTRGRIYVGPLMEGALSAPVEDAHSRPTGALVDAMLQGGIALKAGLASAGATWVIASRTLGRYFEVANVSVDNAWDTQRRRGIAPSLRLAAPVTVVGGGGGSSGSF